MDVFNRNYVKDAARLAHNINNSHFSPQFTNFAITDNEALANDVVSINATNAIVSALKMSKGVITDKRLLTNHIMQAVKKLPRMAKSKKLHECRSFKKDFRNKKLADTMRLAGYPFDQTIASGAI